MTDALIVEAVPHARLRSRRADARRCGHARRPARSADAAPPVTPFHGHIVSGRLWPIGFAGAVVERRRLRRIEAAVLPLPLRPQPIDIAVQQEEQRVARRGRRCWRWSRRSWCAPSPCGLPSMVRKAAYCRAERQRLRLVAQARRCRGCIEERPAVDALHAVGPPELQRIGRAELDGADGIGDAEEVAREDVGRGPIEAPVRQRDARIDRLQLALEIEQVGAVPRQKSGRAVRLRQSSRRCACRGSRQSVPGPDC